MLLSKRWGEHHAERDEYTRAGEPMAKDLDDGVRIGRVHITLRVMETSRPVRQMLLRKR
jgi:hypothetical protein